MNETSNKEAPVAPGGWRRLALRGSVFELVGYGSSMVMRLGGNIVLSRLLFPKAFGLSAEVGFVLFGLAMLSDVGVRQCVIQSPRGDDERFLNTAFSMQVIRGLLMTAGGALLSYPVAHWLFREPELVPLLLASNCSQLISAFNSTSILTLRRHLTLGWVNALDFGQQLLALVVMIAWAYAHPSVWALIIGSLCGTTFYALASHFLPCNYRNRFAWDREAYREFMGFGRWIFGSSAVSFLGSQGDRVLFGRLLGAAELGVYQIGSELSSTISVVVDRLNGGVMYPMLGRVWNRDRDPKILRDAYYRGRVPMDLLAQGSLGMLCGVGGWLVHLIWDPRYWGAGWMLQILCIRAATTCLIRPTESCLTNMGMPRYSFLRSVAITATVWTTLPVGYAIAGVPGLLWAVALTEIPSFIVIWPKFHALKMLRIERELLAVLIFLTALGVGTLLNHVLPAWHISRHHH